MFTVYEFGHLARIFLEHFKYLVNENYTTGFHDQAISVDPCWNGREVGFVVGWHTERDAGHAGRVSVMNDRHGNGVRIYHGDWNHDDREKLVVEMCTTPEMAAQTVYRLLLATAVKVKPEAVPA